MPACYAHPQLLLEQAMPDPLAGAAEAAIFNVDTLVNYMGGDAKGRATVAKIVGDACADGDAPLRAAAAALAERNYAAAGKVLHSLRGSLGSLGAKRFVVSALALEQALAEGRLDELDRLYGEVSAEYHLLLGAAAGWLAAAA
jgi:HPt (histidine-containing phosphotransfer) domain-containing protein